MTVIIDLFDRKLIGWSFSRSLKAAYTNNTGMEDGCPQPAYYPEADFSF
ncbi:MAG: hypothetical protein HPY62_00365 [Bacteroidales bacterium]|nr:hypothetical protein [Bacteroidales bacterium]